MRSAMASPRPRVIAASSAVSRRGGSGRRTFCAISSGRSAAKVTSTSRFPATARTQPATARLNGSVGASRFLVDKSGLLTHHHVGGGLRQLLPQRALIEFRHQRPLQLVALV